MEIINAHVHVYPDKIALKAAQSIGHFYNAPIRHTGTIKELLEENEKVGISKCLIHSVATTIHQVYSINEFISSQIKEHSEFIGFMTLHPDMEEEEMVNEVNKCIALGFKGVKLHPDCQKFYIDEDRAEKIYRACEGKLPILMHMGDPSYDYSSIVRLISVLNKHKDLHVIAAHMGGYTRWGEVGLYHSAKYDNYHFDTSSSLGFMGKDQANLIIKEFGAEKFFFGTDYPMWKADEELERFNKLDLTDNEKELILAKNIKNFLNID